MKSYPLELRERVWEDYEENKKRQGKDKMTLVALAAKWKVSVDWVKKIRKQFLQTGSLEPIKPKTGPKPKLEPHRDRLWQIVKDDPDVTLVEIQEQLPVDVCLQTIFNELNKLKISYKKSNSKPRSNTDRTSLKNKPDGK